MKQLGDIKVERVRMSRQNRAKQFAPFDALKGLQNALRIKEYQAERVQRGDLQEEKINEISNILLNSNKNTNAKVVYFEDGHNKEITGNIKPIFEEQILQVSGVKIKFDDILDIFVCCKNCGGCVILYV